MFRIQSILLCAFIFYSSGIQAQDKHSIYTADSLSESQFSTTSYLSSAQDVKVPFKERWAISTNAVDWILTIPNARVEFDLSNSIYNKFTLSIEGKYNWNTHHTRTPNWTLNLWEVRPELRKYWHTQMRNQQDNFDYKKKISSTKRHKPRFWRGYYVGVYASATGYSFKFSKEGKQGNAYGIGLSGGFGIPLYSFKKNYIDVEFGGSIGFYMNKYNVYRLDRSIDAYVPVDSKSKGLHVVPYPIINNLKVSFVYRFNKSIKKKYTAKKDK